MPRTICVMLAGVLSLVILAGIASSVSHAQGGDWEPLGGPTVPGGTVTALAVAPAAPHPLYAALGERIYRSDDGADSWTPVYTATASIGALAVHPVSPTVVYAGGENALFRTTDGGLTWQQVYTLGVAIAIDPLTPTTVYVCGQLSTGGINVPPTAGVARSTDGGDTWSTVRVGAAWELRSLAIHPATPSILYTGGADEGGKLGAIYRSENAGFSWTRVLTGDHSVGWIRSILINSLDPQVVYANDHNGLFKSTDDGWSWERLIGLPSGWYTTALHPQVPSVLYAAGGYPRSILYRSEDGGASWWQSLNQFPAGVLALAVHPTASDTLYAALYDLGLWRSTNGGGSWTETNTGIRTLARVDALAVDPTAPDTIFAGSGAGRGGLFRSTDGGNTWTTVLTDTQIESLAVHPLTPTLVFAGGGNALYQSTDGGWHWFRDYDVAAASCLAIDPLRDVLYVGGSQGSGSAMHGVVAWRPLAGGWWPSWQTVTLTDSYSIYSIGVHPVTPTVMFAGGIGAWHKTDDIYRSLDGGLHWTAVMTHEPGYGVRAFAFHAPDAVYASGTMGDVYKSTDGGLTWTPKVVAGVMVLEVSTLAVDPRGMVYVGAGNGVWRSWDGGEHWESFGLADQVVRALVVTPGQPQRILAGVTGVWRRWETRTRTYLPIAFKGRP